MAETTYAFKEIHQGRRGDADAQTKRHSRVWQCVTSNKWAGDYAVLGAFIAQVGINFGHMYSISVGDHVEEDPESIVKRITPQQDSEDRCKWVVTVEYSSEYDPEELFESPLDRPAVVEWDSYEIEEAAPWDKDDFLVQNSAGEPFDPPVTKKKFIRVINITKNKEAFDDKVECSYAGKVNNANFEINGQVYPTGTLLIATCPKVSEQTENGVDFVRLNYKVEFNKDGWKTKVLDQGYRYLFVDETSHLVLVNFTDHNQATSSTQMLLKDGEPLNGTGREVDGSDSAQFLEFDFHEAIDFDEIGMI
ncbi:MAG: hypothetical protein U0744_02615 [Gemmataceae bacterium]